MPPGPSSKTGKEKSVIRALLQGQGTRKVNINFNIGLTKRLKNNSKQHKNPWFGKIHGKTGSFDIDLTFLQAVRQVSGVILDANSFEVRRTKGPATTPRFHLTDKIRDIISEYKKIPAICQVSLVSPKPAAVVSPPQPVVHSTPQVSRQQVIYEEDEYEFRGDDEEVQQGFVHRNVNNNDDLESVYSQDSQADCEQEGIYYDTSFKNRIGERLHKKFTNGQILQFEHALKTLQKDGKLLPWSMKEPLLVTFLRELFEV